MKDLRINQLKYCKIIIISKSWAKFYNKLIFSRLKKFKSYKSIKNIIISN